MAMTNYLESGVLNHLFRTSTFAKPTTVAVALVGIPASDTSTGDDIDEPSGGSYARVDLGAPADADWDFMDQVNASGHLNSSATVTFPTATANWGMVSGVCLLDSATGGALLVHGLLTTARDVQNGDTFSFGAGDLDIYLS